MICLMEKFSLLRVPYYNQCCCFQHPHVCHGMGKWVVYWFWIRIHFDHECRHWCWCKRIFRSNWSEYRSNRFQFALRIVLLQQFGGDNAQPPGDGISSVSLNRILARECTGQVVAAILTIQGAAAVTMELVVRRYQLACTNTPLDDMEKKALTYSNTTNKIFMGGSGGGFWSCK